MECECDQCGKCLVQGKNDKESINSKSVPKNNEFTGIISTSDYSSIDPIETEGENPERDKATTKKQDKIQYTTKTAPMDKNNEIPNFHYREKQLKTNKNKNGNIFKRIDKTDEGNKTTKKQKNEVGAKNSGNQAICADAINDPYNNKMTEISQNSTDKEENDTTPSINQKSDLLSNNNPGPRCRCLQTLSHNPEKFIQA